MNTSPFFQWIWVFQMNAWLAPSLVNITVFQLAYQAYFAQYIDIAIINMRVLHYL